MITVRIVQDTRKEKKDGTFPVKIRIADNKNSWRIGTIVSLTIADFGLMMLTGAKDLKSSPANVKNDEKLTAKEKKTLSDKHKQLAVYKRKLDELVVKAYTIIDQRYPFNFKTFSVRFNQKGSRSDLIFLLQNKSQELERNEQYGSSMLYKQAANALVDFANSLNKKVIEISEVSPKWLNTFEKWALREQKKQKVKGTENHFEFKPRFSATTISMYLIRVRAIFNELISNQELPAYHYPFHKYENRNGYKIPRSNNNRRPLEIKAIMDIFNYEPTTQGELFAQDMFIFSYLASGMNPVDIFKLHWTDIIGNQFEFIRKKTRNKTGGVNKITIQLNEHLWSIIKRHGSEKALSNYVFKIFQNEDSENEILRKTRTAISKVNINLKKIANKLSLDKDISFYYARHAYSNNLMNSEVPIAFISKQLGHTDIKTTQNYLDSFSQSNAVDYQKNLLDNSKIKPKNK
ncbi:tyrosine-type recombinase/integrase [Pedobacter agri]|uniref:tyrosine-type recombinase/integrase n=1 Tax=Pedobacter agri TaxID=454586 RepID=UPI00277E83FE|nr:tyrosine-type recombinase/integrase [Pedobacter agri]MDQ1140119.1 integrase/recombinase XerD [Pedobacter agri]